MEKLLYLVPVCGLVALLFALFTARYIGKKDAGTAKMKEIADAIATGARAFLFAVSNSDCLCRGTVFSDRLGDQLAYRRLLCAGRSVLYPGRVLWYDCGY